MTSRYRGDYDGDGVSHVAVFQPSSGRWLARLSSLSLKATTLASLSAGNGVSVPGDYDGDGQLDVAVFLDVDGRSCTRTWSGHNDFACSISTTARDEHFSHDKCSSTY